MYQIDDPTNTTTYPTPPATTGLTPGYFTGGNPATATPGTRVRFWWLNQVQQELMNFLTTAGLTPSKSTNTQVLAACQVMFSKPNFVLLTAASGNYTFPTWCSAFKARIWGAGGGGGGASGTGSIGSGGGGGGYAECNFPVTGGSTVAFTVGRSGAGGGVGANGTAGGSTSFGAYLYGAGGGAGVGATSAIATSAGAGGGGSVLSPYTALIVPGAGGGTGFNAGSAYIGGQSGSTFGSGPGFVSSNSSTAQNGTVGPGVGAGGSGGIAGGGGGGGNNGVIILEF